MGTDKVNTERTPPDKVETLDDLFKQAAHYAEWQLRDGNGLLRPTLFTLTDDNVIAFMVYGKDFADGGSKDNFAASCQLFCIAHAAKMSCLVLETWTAPGEPNKSVPPSESIHRRECVVLMGETSAGPRWKMLNIVRDGRGNFFNLVEDEHFNSLEGVRVSGRFAKILPAPMPNSKATDDLRVAAKLLLESQGTRIMGQRNKKP